MGASMGDVGKGGKVGGASGSPALENLADTMAAQSRTLFGEAQPVTQELFKQIEEALKTGGVGAQLPIAQKGVEASRAATSKALQETQEMGSAMGGGRGSSALTRTLGDIALQGETQTAAIPQQIAESFISVAPTLSTGTSNAALGFGSSAGGIFNQAQGIQAQRDIAKGNQQTQALSSIGSMAGAAAAFY